MLHAENQDHLYRVAHSDEQAALIDRLVRAGHAGEAMMNSARSALVDSIHTGLIVASVATMVGLCLAWFVPPVRVDYFEARPQN